MDRLTELMELVKEEYGIETPEQLLKALQNMGGIDITPLCSKARQAM